LTARWSGLRSAEQAALATAEVAMRMGLASMTDGYYPNHRRDRDVVVKPAYLEVEEQLAPVVAVLEYGMALR
jgi:hypothetical protein